MKNSMVKLAVLSALGMVSAQAFATGLVAIPAAGFANSAYTLCNTTGNFGSVNPTAPTAGANNTCAVFPASEPTSPVTGFTAVASATRDVILNNTYTNNTNVTVGRVTEYVWRNTAATQCIYGAKFVPMNVDYRPTVAGTQYFEVNDLARGGFSASGSVNAGYFLQTSTASPVYRIGRTFTAVQHRAATISSPTTAPGYLDLPGLVGSSASINGLNSWPLAVPTAAQQAATVNNNWIDFTVDVGFGDDDGAPNPATPMTYVQAACTSAAPVAVANAIRLRQTAQENTNFIEVSVPGFTPPGGTATPAPVVPF